LDSINAILNKIATFGEEGTIVGFKPINNNLLEEEAKALRYYMDFNFEHGSARGILSPVTNVIEDAVETAANFTGHNAAAEANQTARTLYREWATDYDNPFIK